ncbi:hypothetical protein AKJ66_01890 [candidate division MSBL1 archaeon SCGC-AAA259E22]|uniref:Uncharacterized protein n=1 Tax=candidate division MSBL1 archaeon SCGC-AAA259E22 TaxID=1698265 RepID=A0A133UH68_9EURY|nr:hypothetical protein AKJ66_01890 [candidate division MSBL1 archaeon SCGC-AAA259E22]
MWSEKTWLSLDIFRQFEKVSFLKSVDYLCFGKFGMENDIIPYCPECGAEVRSKPGEDSTGNNNSRETEASGDQTDQEKLIIDTGVETQSYKSVGWKIAAGSATVIALKSLGLAPYFYLLIKQITLVDSIDFLGSFGDLLGLLLSPLPPIFKFLLFDAFPIFFLWLPLGVYLIVQGFRWKGRKVSEEERKFDSLVRGTGWLISIIYFFVVILT